MKLPMALRISFRWFIVLVLVSLISACSNTVKTKHEDKIYQAYGDTWVYSMTEIRTSYWSINSPHGFLGQRESYQEEHSIRNSAGKLISIPDSLYALQDDGALKQIECCKYFRESGYLYNINGKLVFIFSNARKYITDCFIYPSGHPNNEFEIPDKQIYGITVFAEFDPNSNTFKTSTFAAGDNYLPFEYRAAELRSGRRDLSIQQDYEFRFARRKPFICDSSGSTANAAPTLPELDLDAYQLGVTQQFQFSVATNSAQSLIKRLQVFAQQNHMKMWEAKSADPGVQSLALVNEEILTVVTGDSSGLWHVAFYRRAANPPFTLPPEERVTALSREIRKVLESVSGVFIVTSEH